MKRRYQLGWAGLRSKASLMSGMPLSQSPVRLQALPRSARMSLSCGLRISARSYAAMLRVGSRLILQLSLLVDQEFGGLSFPVAGFGDGLMEPAPERPSENEVDAELSWKRAMRRRISGMLKAMNAPDPSPPFGRRG